MAPTGAARPSTPTEHGPGLAARARDWAATLPFLIAFGAILLVFDPLQRIARLFGQRPQEFMAGLLQTSLTGAIRLCGARIHVERSPAVAPRTAYILIANHQSMFDIPILGALLFSNYPKYISTRARGRYIPSSSYTLPRGGNALSDRGDRDGATRAIRELGERAQARDVSVVIYPEGTRARAGELGAFRPAGTQALLDAAPKLPVVPVTIDGSWQLLRHNLMPVPFGVRIRVRFGDPMPRGEASDATLLERARTEIEATLQRWREEDASPASG